MVEGGEKKKSNTMKGARLLIPSVRSYIFFMCVKFNPPFEKTWKFLHRLYYSCISYNALCKNILIFCIDGDFQWETAIRRQGSMNLSLMGKCSII